MVDYEQLFAVPFGVGRSMITVYG